ncbi:MAG: glycosyltransferase family 9 protein [Rhodospirillales bacterium]|nr:MAG: glycosyltransferase family 9 protein [Rhodospirillales bacterium]
MTDAPILIIKHGALGDLVQALGPIRAIRRHHPGQQVVLLTTRPFAAFAEACPDVDVVWIDERPRAFQAGRWLALRRRLRQAGFARVYDLQTSDRSSAYFQLMLPGPRPEWCGIARGCSHRQPAAGRSSMHTVDRQAAQLRIAGIATVPPADLSWAKADIGRYGLAGSYALLAPGSAPHRPAKRWPAERFAALARHLWARGIRPVLVGTAGEADLHSHISDLAGGAPLLSLAGATSLLELATLARGAVAAVGNDTGPMHMTAAAGCPTLVLFSSESDPARCVPRGDRVVHLRREALDQLPLDAVTAAVDGLVAPARERGARLAR